MTPLSDKAFAVMAYCPEEEKYYGITVDYVRKGKYKFVWAFPISREKAQREGYDDYSVKGGIELDKDFPGCPHCEAKRFVFCSCGAVMCWTGKKIIHCPICGSTGLVLPSLSVALRGGGF